MSTRSAPAEGRETGDRRRGPACPLAVITAVVIVVAALLASSFLPAHSETVDPIGSWSAVESMELSRVDHAATRLDGPRCQSGAPPAWCGDVLVVAGSRSESWSSTSLYDADTGKWAPTRGQLQSPHAGGHTSTRLGDGRVLVVGGGGADKGAPEIYDPDSGAWSVTSPIRLFDVDGPAGTQLNRHEIKGHEAVRLDGPACRRQSPAPYCGQVLVTGSTHLESAGRYLSLLYDPVQNSWAPTTPTLEVRIRPTATLLDGPPCHEPSPPAYCGTVLVAGGGFGTEAARTAEVYDPATATWTPTAPLAAVTEWVCSNLRACHSATLLRDGEVLLVGGLEDTDERPLVDTGVQRDDRGRRSQRYDPLTRQWRLAAPTEHDRRRASVTLLPDGRALASGGVLGSGGSTSGALLASAEIYDASADTWSPADSLDVPRGFHSATLLADGRVLVAGGRGNGTGGITSAETFDISGTSSPPSVLGVEPAVGSTAGGTAVTISGSGFTVVTSVKFGAVDARHYVVQDGGKLTAVSPANPSGSVDVTVTTPDGTSIGGPQSRFSFVSDAVTWRPTEQPLLKVKQDHTATLLAARACEGEPAAAQCGKVLVVGTSPFHSADKPTLYDPVSGAWEDTAGGGGIRYDHSATSLTSGRVLLVGGRPTDDFRRGRLKTAEIYDPATGRWAPTGELVVARAGHTAINLDTPTCSVAQPPRWCGKVLVMGGRAERPGEIGVQADDPACKVARPPPYCARVSNKAVSDAVTASAELYDPTTGTWQAVPDMHVAREGHTSTLLPDGRVLVTGGLGLEPDSQATKVPGGLSVAPDRQPAEVAAAEVYDPESNSWTVTGSMGSRRFGHTATVLEGACSASARCGQVLVTGGAGGVAAELYNPVDGTWRMTGIPKTARRAHTATLLPGGDVLVAGGSAGVTPLESAELYDPTTGEWSVTASMREGRAHHDAVLLEAGDVLVIGPGTGAELYDERSPPATPVVARVEPSVAPSGPMSSTTKVILHGRAFPSAPSVRFGEAPGVVEFASATQIDVRPPPDHPQGTVQLTVADGKSSSVPFPFTFASGQWRDSGPLLDSGNGTGGGRYLHTASLLQDGRVLVAGGTTQFFGCACLSPQSASLLSAAELYDPTTGRWTATGSLGTARFSHTATVLSDGRVLVSGGQAEVGFATPAAEVYDPGTGTWSATPPMKFPRMSHSATLLLDGRVMVVGGAVEETQRARAIATVEIYDPRTNRWTPAASLRDARASHSATLLDGGSVLVTGGLAPDSRDGPADQDGVALASAERYDPISGRWILVESLGVGRFDHTATLLKGLACGQRGATGSCGMVLVTGGTAGGFDGLLAAELYDPATREWTPAASLQRSRGGHTAALLDDGRVLVMGSGERFPGSQVPPPTGSAEVYDPANDEWSLTMAAGRPRGGHTLTLLADGRALVAGGYATIEYEAPVFTHHFDAVSELYVPAPTLLSALPAAGPTRGGTEIAVEGLGFDRTTEVRLGGAPAAFTSRSPRELIATAPAHERGPARLEAIGPGGTSNRLDRMGQVDFTYRGQPGEIAGLVAEALSSSAIMVSFAAADDGSGGAGLVTSYIVKQSDSEIRTPEDFAAATSLCENGVCVVEPGLAVKIRIDDLEPDRTYHYAVQAVNDDDELGPRSASVAATTLPGGAGTCPAVRAPGADELGYAGGVYSLVGLPSGTMIDANSPLYGWLDQGAGSGYSVMGSNQPVEAGRGYWAWFACPRLVSLNGPGEPAVSLPLGGYHASMIGNPSGTSPASVTGHDFAARWDPALNDGAGGYHVSGYREAQTLAVGEGAWAFTYQATTVAITTPAS